VLRGAAGFERWLQEQPVLGGSRAAQSQSTKSPSEFHVTIVSRIASSRLTTIAVTGVITDRGKDQRRKHRGQRR
jgi:hypothetical protein